MNIVDIRPLDAKTAAKLLGFLYGVTGLQQAVAPNFSGTFYGFKKGKLNAINCSIIHRNGTVLLGLGLVAYCLLFRSDCDQNLALGIGAIPIAVKFLSSLLENDAATIGPNRTKEMLALAVHCLAAYGGLTSADWAPIAFRLLSIWCIAVGAHMPIHVSSAAELWEVKNTDETTHGLIQIMGSNYATLGTLYGALAWSKDLDPAKAYGYASVIAMTLYSRAILFSSEFDAMGLDKSKFVFWIVMVTLVVVSTLL
eukprot:CAMPEP_0178752444 /NCGR_PEP_ID=MMETSP0744-20121128/11068_1 /TAXON_ID=913974 /ORGANISM="Nitzschia punctata, Strain CCMP561" /LENGTH=253 /DNA_ID=CAMNT_0020406167 /DNA_START=277 /DNA_END=1038 /DNA_ORIENTATION=+